MERIYDDYNSEKSTVPMFSSRNAKWIMGIIFAFSVAFLIAGIVMLAVGITKSEHSTLLPLVLIRWHLGGGSKISYRSKEKPRECEVGGREVVG